MGMIVPKLSYFKQAGATAGVSIRNTPCGLNSITCTATGGTVTIYDGLSTSGTVIYSKALTAGEVVHWGGVSIAAKLGLYLVVGAGDFVIVYD